MKAIILSIGDELLSGDISNTNGSFIAAKLSENNIEVTQILAIGDHYDRIMNSLQNISQDIDIVLVTGGLGPTHDDITKKVVVDFFETKLVFVEEIYNGIKERFEILGLQMTESNTSQAYLPENCEIIPNYHGTAMGMKFTRNNVDYYFMPGVPHEMKKLLTEQIIPKLNINQKDKLEVKIIRTIGVGESILYENMKSWIAENPKIITAFYPKFSGVDIKLKYHQEDLSAIDQLVGELGLSVYGFDEETIEEKIAEVLIEKKLTFAAAESCTGGLISSRLTDVSGSSQYMMYGIVTYSNEAKMKLLGVKNDTLVKYGAVSKEVAIEMAEGVRKHSNCDIGISTTGIAGPTGGTQEKPVGTLWCAVSVDNRTEAFHYCWNINREANKKRFSQFVFKNLLERLKE